MTDLLSLADRTLAVSFATKRAWNDAANAWADEADQQKRALGRKRGDRYAEIRHWAIRFGQDTEALLGWLLYGDSLPDDEDLKEAAAHIQRCLRL